MPSSDILDCFEVKPEVVFKSSYDLMVVYPETRYVGQAQPNLGKIKNLPYRGGILTAPGTESDVYSRCFYPALNVPGDPVTGSAHCVIVP